MSGGSGSPPPEARSSLAALLFNLNSSAVSSISATINGSARLVERGTEEEKYYREKHLENHAFETEASTGAVDLLRRRESVIPQHQSGSSAPLLEQREGDGGRECFVAGEEVRVIVVGIKAVRIADWKGSVKDWIIEPAGGGDGDAAAAAESPNGLVNGL